MNTYGKLRDKRYLELKKVHQITLKMSHWILSHKFCTKKLGLLILSIPGIVQGREREGGPWWSGPPFYLIPKLK